MTKRETNRRARWTLLPAILLSTACGGAPQSVGAQTPVPASSSQQPRKLVPAGFGTLRQDEFTLQIRSDQLLVKVTPLNETVIRTSAPDTYNRLHRMAETRREEAARKSGTQDLELFQVTFFSYQPDVTYQPENLIVTHQGQQFRPVAILPITGGWGRQQLGQQEQQTAVYAFNGIFDYDLPITVAYGVIQNETWNSIIQKLEIERAKILARAGGKTP